MGGGGSSGTLPVLRTDKHINGNRCRAETFRCAHTIGKQMQTAEKRRVLFSAFRAFGIPDRCKDLRRSLRARRPLRARRCSHRRFGFHFRPDVFIGKRRRNYVPKRGGRSNSSAFAFDGRRRRQRGNFAFLKKTAARSARPYTEKTKFRLFRMYSKKRRFRFKRRGIHCAVLRHIPRRRRPAADRAAGISAETDFRRKRCNGALRRSVGSNARMRYARAKRMLACPARRRVYGHLRRCVHSCSAIGVFEKNGDLSSLFRRCQIFTRRRRIRRMRFILPPLNGRTAAFRTRRENSLIQFTLPITQKRPSKRIAR